MTDAYLRKMYDFAGPEKGVLPTIRSRPEPLAAIYPRQCLDQISSALQGIDFSVTGVSENIAKSGYLRIIEVNNEDEALFRSMNKPEDLLV